MASSAMSRLPRSPDLRLQLDQGFALRGRHPVLIPASWAFAMLCITRKPILTYGWRCQEALMRPARAGTCDHGHWGFDRLPPFPMAGLTSDAPRAMSRSVSKVAEDVHEHVKTSQRRASLQAMRSAPARKDAAPPRDCTPYQR